MSAPQELPTWGREVVEAEVLGAPCKVFAARPRHAGDLLLEGRSHATATYVVEGSRRTTHAQVESAVADLRNELSDRGVGPGDRVMLLGANSVEFVTTLWATWRAGAILVLGNAWWSPSEVAHGVATTDPALVVCDDRRHERVPTGTAALRYEDVRRVGEGRPVRHDEPPAPRAEDDACLIIFTSGTTGAAKAAVLSHRAVVATCQSLLLLTGRLPRGPQPPKPGHATLLSVPLFHIGGLQQVITAMVTGARLVFFQGRFDPQAVTDIIDREDIRVWSTVPTMAQAVADHLQVTGSSLRGLRTLGLGGSPASEDLRAQLRTAFPSARDRLGVTWGLTEAGGVVTTGAGPELERRPGAVGRCLPVADVRVDDPDSEGVGELLVRSPSVMLGYWGADGLDPGPIGEGRWLRSGDLGWVDDERWVYVGGRNKDIIIRGGENISAVGVEEALLRHPGVLECAVVAVPDRLFGEQVGAVVVARPGHDLTQEDLIAFLEPSLAHFEVPSRWWMRAHPLPRNATGKVVKHRVAAEMLEHLAPVRGQG